MADFQSEIPEEYLDSEFDFGFTAVDEGELRGITTGEESESTGGSVSSEHLDDVNDKLVALESKINAVLIKLDNESDQCLPSRYRYE